MSPRIFLLAGEPSGDRLGAALIAGLRSLAPGADLAGVGGPEMAAQGLESLFPMSDLSVMGVAEVLPRYPLLRRRLAEATAAAVAFAPDAMVTIDSPDFSLRLAARVRAARPETLCIHYVAPSVWAWRPGRARRMARVIDHVLALLPFEPPYMTAAGMTCDFVGHPAAAEPVADATAALAFRRSCRIAPGAPLLLVLPGSRRGEVERLGPRFGAALAPVLARHPAARVVVPAVAHLADRVAAMAAGWPGAPVVIDPRRDPPEVKRAAFRAADAALAASGTVSLELAAAGVPMVIGYDVAPLSRLVFRLFVRVPSVTIPNLVTGTRAVPEFLGPDCRPDRLGAAVADLLADPGRRAAQRAVLDRTMAMLGRGGDPPGQRAARSVLAAIDRRISAAAARRPG